MRLVVRSKAVFDGRLLNVKSRFEQIMAASSQLLVDNNLLKILDIDSLCYEPNFTRYFSDNKEKTGA